MANPQGPGMAPSCSPGALPTLVPVHQSFLVSDSHTSSGLIGAVHPFSHPTGHSGDVAHHMNHMHGQSEALNQIPKGMGGFKMAEGVHGAGSKGGYPGVDGFGFNSYARTEATNKLNISPAWDNKVSMQHCGQTAGAPSYGSPQTGPQALDELEVANLNAFLDSMNSEAKADLMHGQHF